MKRRALLSIVSASVLALGISQAASAQTQYNFKIPNGFVANGKALPAGSYVLSVSPAGDMVTLAPAASKGASVMLVVETRVAERKPMAGPEIVFDNVNGQLNISELLVPGEDGYMLLVTKGKHTHESVKGSSTKK
jgi:hypothetical protein